MAHLAVKFFSDAPNQWSWQVRRTGAVESPLATSGVFFKTQALAYADYDRVAHVFDALEEMMGEVEQHCPHCGRLYEEEK